ncbi:cytochrome c-type biogenesis protein [Oceanibium sediminis]|uniref:cytochrome c-type biogenesis protein n=1 Tax=Oceanibium sediminis TaxID=2026339 RepID=UPI000DD46C15|nr:cytochrome c-type biogenesis protein [Oceanibium sediminis]
MIRALVVLVTLVTLALPALAVQPDEVLDDPVLEQRARDLSKEIRCLVCRNESIDESNAQLAKDLRILVRDRLVEGDSNAEVLDYLVARYGEYVLLRPRFTAGNAALWLAAPVLLLFGGLTAALFLRRRSRPAEPAGLSAAEQKRLREVLDDDRIA